MVRSDRVHADKAPPDYRNPGHYRRAAQHITAALASRARCERLPYAQIDLRTGEFAGTTSFADPEPGLRALSIGYTWLGLLWWRTGINTDATLLMLTFAFAMLGAVRVSFVTDIRNTRA